MSEHPAPAEEAIQDLLFAVDTARWVRDTADDRLVRRDAETRVLALMDAIDIVIRRVRPSAPEEEAA